MWKLIEGKTPNYEDLKKYTPEQWMNLFRFFEFFLFPEDNEKRFDCTLEKIQEVELTSLKKDSPYKEYIYRVGRWSHESKPEKFAQKLESIFLVTLTFLKKNPGSVSEDMRAFITVRHPKKMGWCLVQYETKQTPAGEIVTRNTDVQEHATQTLPSLQAKIMNSLIKLADIYEDVANSISKGDFNKVDVMDKIKTLKDLGFIFQAAAKRPTQNTFTTINLNGNAREIEKALLDFSKKK